jgi:alpha/beta superfamily hydrolase
MMSKPGAGSEAVWISGPAGKLEGLLERSGEDVTAVAVVCHPHPEHEGSMQNKVTHMLARSFRELGAAALRFNFRGVGGSEGEFDKARGETGDAQAAIAWMRERYPGLPLWLGGFSFGAQIAIQAAPRAQPDWLVTVAPPVQRFGGARPARPDCPWLLIQGMADEVVDATEVERWAASMQPPPSLVMLPGVDHFFHGNLTRLREAVQAAAPGPA